MLFRSETLWFFGTGDTTGRNTPVPFAGGVKEPLLRSVETPAPAANSIQPPLPGDLESLPAQTYTQDQHPRLGYEASAQTSCWSARATPSFSPWTQPDRPQRSPGQSPYIAHLCSGRQPYSRQIQVDKGAHGWWKQHQHTLRQIGRASCRERVYVLV